MRVTRWSTFESRWLAEAIRLREEHAGVLEDGTAVAAARAEGGDLETRVRVRAVHLAEREGLAAVMQTWQSRARLLLLLLAVLAVASGFGAALAVLGDGTRPVNVVWALGGLLGVHLLSLLFWFAGLSARPAEAGGALGRGWLWLSSRFAGGADAVHLARSLTGLLGAKRITRWWLGAVTHGLWLCALGGAFVGLLAALSARRYGFVWETTILPAEVFVRLVEVLGWLPAQAGFLLPGEAAVRMSGGVPSADEAVRVAWSSWLVGCVAIYGIAPRALLWTGCLGAWRLGRRRVRLNLGLPGYAMLLERLAPASELAGVTDPAPAKVFAAHLAGRRTSGKGAAAVGLELGPDLGWPPALPAAVRDMGVLDSREQRRQVLAQLDAEPPGRLMVACDVRLSPDRGSLELIAELSNRAAACQVWLMHGPNMPDTARPVHWREALRSIGMKDEAITELESEALGWLAACEDRRAPAGGGRRE